MPTPKQEIVNTENWIDVPAPNHSDAEYALADAIDALEQVLGVLNHGTENPHWPHIDRIRSVLFSVDPDRFAAYKPAREITE